jgi:hypothetical protein
MACGWCQSQSAGTWVAFMQVGALEAIRVKILVRGQPNKLDAVRVSAGYAAVGPQVTVTCQTGMVTKGSENDRAPVHVLTLDGPREHTSS